MLHSPSNELFPPPPISHGAAESKKYSMDGLNLSQKPLYLLLCSIY